MAELLNTTLFADANLVAYYRVESGALTTDSKGAFTLTNNNTVGEDTGKYGGAADFGTTNTNKSLSHTTDTGIGAGACTLIGWFKCNTAIGDGAAWTFIHQEDNGTSVNYEIRYSRSGATYTVSFFRDRQGVASEGNSATSDLGTEWHQIALTYDATNLRGYIDNVLVAGPTALSGNGVGVAADSFAIGNFRGTASGNARHASIDADDVAVFTDALTADEITILYQDVAGTLDLTSKMW